MICGHWVGKTYVLLRLIKIGSFLNIFRSETFLCRCLWILIINQEYELKRVPYKRGLIDLRIPKISAYHGFILET